jgi:hypothetical protein
LFGLVFMVVLGVWHAPLLEFATISVPDLTNLINVTRPS